MGRKVKVKSMKEAKKFFKKGPWVTDELTKKTKLEAQRKRSKKALEKVEIGLKEVSYRLELMEDTLKNISYFVSLIVNKMSDKQEAKNEENKEN